MTDVHDRETRSKNMAAIKWKHTKPELLIRKFLHSQGFRFRLHDKKLPGSPDIKLTKLKTIVNVHGCYFHRHSNCKLCSTPAATSTTDWQKKFAQTIERDKRNSKLLKKLGWKEIIIWECKTKSRIKLNRTFNSLLKKLS